LIGALSASLPQPLGDIRSELENIQSDLFHIGAWLATSPGAPAADLLPPLDSARASALERSIDRFDENFPAEGVHSAGRRHELRLVPRGAHRLPSDRAPRRAPGRRRDGCAAAEQLKRSIVYLNRLSDYFFVLARHINRSQGIEDTLWKR